jgi:hypothetical protein
MTILTAEQFKDRLKTQHVVTNVVVKEPVTIDFRDGGSFSGDLLIRNCDLKSFRISDCQLSSLTIQKGSIKELVFQTSAQMHKVSITKCSVQTLTTTETLIEEFEYIAGLNKTVFTGQLPNLNKLSLSGVLKSVSLINPSCNTIQLVNFQANEVNLISLQPGSLRCKNVTCNTMMINYGTNAFESVSLENLTSRDFQLWSEVVRSLKYKGDIKYLAMSTIPEPVPVP